MEVSREIIYRIPIWPANLFLHLYVSYSRTLFLIIPFFPFRTMCLLSCREEFWLVFSAKGCWPWVFVDESRGGSLQTPAFHHLRLPASLLKHDLGSNPDAESNQLVEHKECSAPKLCTQHCWQSDYESATVIFLFYFLMLFIYIVFIFKNKNLFYIPYSLSLSHLSAPPIFSTPHHLSTP